MLTLGLAIADAFGSQDFQGLYLAMFILDCILFDTLPKLFNKGA